MASFQFKGMEEYALKLSRLANGSEEIAGKAIYEGAKIVADAIKANIEDLPVIYSQKGTEEDPIEGLTQKQKQGLIDGFGISDMRIDNGYYNVKVGFDGYNSNHTKKFPKGQPNQLIARVIESGTSIRKKHPFVAPAVRKTKNKAVEVMGQIVDREIEKIMK